MSRKSLTILALLALFVALTALSGCAKPATPVQQSAQQASQEPAKPSTPAFAGQYLDQKAPGMTPELFAQSLFRMAAPDAHSVCQFSPDGHEVYWTPMPNTAGIQFMKLENGAWTKPAVAPFSREGDDSPTFSPDGKRLYFLRRDGKGSRDLYYVERTEEGWLTPVALPDEVNSEGLHWQLSVATNGDIYYGWQDTSGTMDIHLAELVDGEYVKVSKLGDAVNDPKLADFSPFVARDGSYLLFSRSNASNDNADIYISFKAADGSWSKAVKLGSSINTPSQDLCPWVSDDGKYLFFLSMRSGRSLPYWVDAKVIEDLRPQ